MTWPFNWSFDTLRNVYDELSTQVEKCMRKIFTPTFIKSNCVKNNTFITIPKPINELSSSYLVENIYGVNKEIARLSKVDGTTRFYGEDLTDREHIELFEWFKGNNLRKQEWKNSIDVHKTDEIGNTIQGKYGPERLFDLTGVIHWYQKILVNRIFDVDGNNSRVHFQIRGTWLETPSFNLQGKNQEGVLAPYAQIPNIIDRLDDEEFRYRERIDDLDEIVLQESFGIIRKSLLGYLSRKAEKLALISSNPLYVNIIWPSRESIDEIVEKIYYFRLDNLEKKEKIISPKEQLAIDALKKIIEDISKLGFVFKYDNSVKFIDRLLPDFVKIL